MAYTSIYDGVHIALICIHQRVGMFTMHDSIVLYPFHATCKELTKKIVLFASLSVRLLCVASAIREYLYALYVSLDIRAAARLVYIAICTPYHCTAYTYRVFGKPSTPAP